MLNKAILVGRLTRDPESRNISQDNQVCQFTVAVDRTFKSRDGNKETDFIPVVAWRKTAELCARYLNKGSLVGVCGRIQVRSYDGSDGVRRYVTEVIADEVQFLSPKSESQPQSSPPPRDPGYENFGIPVDGFTEIDDLDVPF